MSKFKHGYGQIQIHYKNIDHTVDSIVLGDGGTRITTIYDPKECVTGINFAKATEGRKVGEICAEDGVPKDPNEDPLWTQKNAFFQILSDNPASFDVLIARLQQAKESLIEQQAQGGE